MASVLGTATGANNCLPEVYPKDTARCVEYTVNINPTVLGYRSPFVIFVIV